MAKALKVYSDPMAASGDDGDNRWPYFMETKDHRYSTHEHYARMFSAAPLAFSALRSLLGFIEAGETPQEPGLRQAIRDGNRALDILSGDQKVQR